MRILLVEDDKSTREVLKLYFCDESAGRHCDTAESLFEATEKVTVTRYDIIVMDLLLKDGLATPLIHYVRRLYPENTPEICIVSAMNCAARIAEQNGVDKCIVKPFTLETIDELVLSKKCR